MRLALALACFLLAACTTVTGRPVPAPSSGITAVRLPAGTFPRFPAVAQDGTLWCSVSGAEAIARIDAGGTVSNATMPGPRNSLAGVVEGPDGLVWFAGHRLIGRVTDDMKTNGWLHRARGVDLGLPNALTAGPDGAIWFTNEMTPPAISRISPAGALTHHPIQAAAAPTMPSITTGPDGALWFTERFASGGGAPAIGRMTVKGDYRRWEVPGALGDPNRITSGPDGALWFTAARGIGRITAEGAISVFPVPARPVDITATRDLWFTTDQRSVGRVTTSGEITLHPVEGSVNLLGIADAADGSLWVADGEGNTLWHIKSPGT